MVNIIEWFRKVEPTYLDKLYEKIIRILFFDFYRLNKNKRHIVQTPVIFRCCEDFTERYENVPISGMNYRFFVVATEKYPPFYVNTRVYSCILIDNSIKHRW